MGRPRGTATAAPTNKRRIAEATGRRGERLAAWWLRLKGWQILDRRVRTPVGEVDLVAKRGNLIALAKGWITPRLTQRSTLMEVSTVIPKGLAVLVSAALLSACVSTDFSHRPPELIVEGDEASYPLFEKAAEACAYRDYWRFSGATVGNNISVGPHFNLFATNKRAARCAVDWVEKHRETGLHVSYH